MDAGPRSRRRPRMHRLSRRQLLLDLGGSGIGVAVLGSARASRATVHAGEADIADLSSPRTVAAVADGEDVFGLHVGEPLTDGTAASRRAFAASL